MPRALSAHEQRTITTVNNGEDTATVFACEKTLQEHLEVKLGLTRTTDTGFGTVECRLYNEWLQPYN